MTAAATPASRPAEQPYPVLRSIGGIPSVERTMDFEPHLEAACFMTPVVDAQSTAVVRLRGRDLDCGALECTPTTPGFTVELLDMCTRQGDELLVGLRIRREEATRSLGCEVRFHAGSSAAHATVMIRG